MPIRVSTWVLTHSNAEHHCNDPPPFAAPCCFLLAVGGMVFEFVSYTMLENGMFLRATFSWRYSQCRWLSACVEFVSLLLLDVDASVDGCRWTVSVQRASAEGRQPRVPRVLHLGRVHRRRGSPSVHTVQRRRNCGPSLPRQVRVRAVATDAGLSVFLVTCVFVCVGYLSVAVCAWTCVSVCGCVWGCVFVWLCGCVVFVRVWIELMLL